MITHGGSRVFKLTFQRFERADLCSPGVRHVDAQLSRPYRTQMVILSPAYSDRLLNLSGQRGSPAHDRLQVWIVAGILDPLTREDK